MKRLLVSLCCMIVICLSCISATAEKLVYNDFEYELMEDGSAIDALMFHSNMLCFFLQPSPYFPVSSFPFALLFLTFQA